MTDHCMLSARVSDYRAFSHDVTAAILVSQNNETAAMLVSHEDPHTTFFCIPQDAGVVKDARV